MSGSNLPPGCRISDIPGNRPEDERYEAELTDAIEYIEKANPEPGEMMLIAKLGVAALQSIREHTKERVVDARHDDHEAALAGYCPWCKNHKKEEIEEM